LEIPEMTADGIHAWENHSTEHIADDHKRLTATCSKCGITKTLDIDAMGNLIDPEQSNPIGGCPK
jgi:hypothetical protein